MVKRKNYLDILRVLAALAVALFHVLGSSVNNDPMITEQVRRIVSALSVTLQWHVPVFFMITGYIWLSDDKICVYRKMWVNVRRFVLVLFTVGVSYAAMERFFDTRVLSPGLVMYALADVMTGNLWDHMWYLYTIIGVYLFLPVLKPFFEYNSSKTIAVFVGVLFFFTIVSPIVASGFGYIIPINFPVTAPAFYICAGGLIAKLQMTEYEKKNGFYSLAIFVGCVATAFCVFLFAPESDYYFTLLNSISAVSIFVSITIICADTNEKNWLRSIADCSFGIYLFHPFFLNIILKVLHFYPARQMPYISLLLTFVGVIGVSYFMTYFLRKIKLIRKYIL